MKTSALLACLVLTALLSRPAAADPFGVDLELVLADPQVPAFFLEARSRFGTQLDGSVTWSVNGMPIDKTPVLQARGGFSEVRSLPLTSPALVCAEYRGRLDYGGAVGLTVSARSCAVWQPWLGSPSEPATPPASSRVARERRAPGPSEGGARAPERAAAAPPELLPRTTDG